MDGATTKELEGAGHMSQQTHWEATKMSNGDVTLIGKGLDPGIPGANINKIFCCNAYYTMPPLWN